MMTFGRKNMVLVFSGIALMAGFLGSGRLQAETEETPPADQNAEMLVQAMVEAHGGYEKWNAAPTVSFEDHFLPAGAPSAMVSQVTVEQGRRRSYIDFPGSQMQMAWDGERAWSENWASPLPPRFLAQLNYYFLNLPWLAKDPGVRLTAGGTDRIFDDPTEYLTVKMTFEPGVGDTPDDYYILYIHPTTHRLKACKYIVTYATLLPEGTKVSPEHLLVFDEFTTTNGLVVPTKYTIYQEDRSVYASCTIENWSFTKTFDAVRMIKSPDAELDESNPGS